MMRYSDCVYLMRLSDELSEMRLSEQERPVNFFLCTSSFVQMLKARDVMLN